VGMGRGREYSPPGRLKARESVVSSLSGVRRTAEIEFGTIYSCQRSHLQVANISRPQLYSGCTAVLTISWRARESCSPARRGKKRPGHAAAYAEESFIDKLRGQSGMGSRGTPFPHIQFTVKCVSPPQISQRTHGNGKGKARHDLKIDRN